MTNEEFAAATRGITAARIAEIVGKGRSSVQAYIYGRLPVPDDVAMTVARIATAIEENTHKKGVKNMRTLKKVINGKLYDTSTATMIAELSAGGDWNDFRHLREELYRTRRGSFFLAGEGGAMTHYAQRCSDNSMTGGEGIIPLDEGEAREWLEAHADADTYIAVFGRPEEA